MEKKFLKVGVLVVIIAFSVGYLIWELNKEAGKDKIILATTTSTYDSGLLDYIVPEFEEDTGIEVNILSVGTGEAIELGQTGDADLILVHSRSKEDLFVEQGYGIDRTCIMYNDFIIIGPSADPAGINGESNITIAMQKLKVGGENANTTFYSRGDNSGTNNKELALWALIGFTPDSGSDIWYFETGQGMGDTLTITDQNDGYTLIDRGTWLALKDSVAIVIHVQGDQFLLNPYGAILVNPSLNDHVNHESAKLFISFLVSNEGQKLIGDFLKNGEQLFQPCFGTCNETHGCETTEVEKGIWKDRADSYDEEYVTSLSSSGSKVNWVTNTITKKRLSILSI